LHSGATSAKSSCPWLRSSLIGLSLLVSRPLVPLSPSAGVCWCCLRQTWLRCTLAAPTHCSLHPPTHPSPSSHSRCVFTAAAPLLHSPLHTNRPDACRRREGRRAPETDQRAARPNPRRHPKRYKLPPQAHSLATLDSATATSPSPSKSSALPGLAPASPKTGCLKTPKMHALSLGLQPAAPHWLRPPPAPGMPSPAHPGYSYTLKSNRYRSSPGRCRLQTRRCCTQLWRPASSAEIAPCPLRQNIVPTGWRAR
jgi:hypothetical protein